jgi:hypothetical protein
MVLGLFQADNHPENADQVEIQLRVHHKDHRQSTHGLSKASHGGSRGLSKG